jgi:Phosphoribosyl transferase domain
MEDQPFGEFLSARRCWACCSDDLTEPTWEIIGGRLICGVCIRGRDIPRTVAEYRGRRGALRASLRAAYAAIVNCKERQPGWEALEPVLAGVLSSAVRKIAAVHGLPNDTVIVPVPSYQDRRPHVARLCASVPGFRVLPALQKVRDFRQARLGGVAARRAASADAYRARRRVKNRSVIIADDIMTSGATLAACANALYDKGAAEVYGAVIVRTIRKPRSGLVVLGPKQVTVQWAELDRRRRTGMSPGKSKIWVRFACSKRCPHILTAGPFRVPPIGTDSLQNWTCDCRQTHAITLRREWHGPHEETVTIGVADRQPSELLVALRHYRA